MESKIGSATYCGDEMEVIGIESLQFDQVMEVVPVGETGGSSFTALLELPPNQAVQLLHSPETEIQTETVFLSDYSTVFTTATPVKEEPFESPNSSLLPSDLAAAGNKSTKRKDREKKGKVSVKKTKSTGNEESEQLPYVHVRARRGQATDSHSLAERARREKINARMKLLQDLVPGCNKISGTALVLDEIINHVQSLQRQVEFLSMRLAAVNPRIDINLDSLFSPENESFMDCSLPGAVMPTMWLEGQVNGNRQPYQQLCHLDGIHQPVWGRDEGNPKFISSDNSLLSYDSSANSASLHTNHPLKMEL